MTTWGPTDASATGGSVYIAGPTYSTVRSATTGGTVGTTSLLSGQWYSTNYYCMNSFFKFDTSSIPDDATISSVTLSLVPYGLTYNVTKHITCVYAGTSWGGSTLVTSDYQGSTEWGSLSLVATLDTNGLVVDTRATCTSESSFGNYINKTGETRLMIISSRQIDGTQPYGGEYCSYYYNNESYNPRLTIEYSTGSNTIASVPMAASANMPEAIGWTGILGHPIILNEVAIGIGWRRCVVHYLPIDSTIEKIYVYLAGGSSAGNLKLAIYDDDGSNGRPSTRLGVTSEIGFTLSQAAGWVEGTLSSPLELTAGNYWLAFIASQDYIGRSLTTGGSSSRCWAAETYNSTTSPANPFGTPNEAANCNYSIYAPYSLPVSDATISLLDAFRASASSPYPEVAIAFSAAPIESPLLNVSASMNSCGYFFLDSGVIIERKVTIDGEWGLVKCVKQESDYYDDPGPLTDDTTYFYRITTYNEEGTSPTSDEKSIYFIGRRSTSVDVECINYTAALCQPDVGVSKDILPEPMSAYNICYSPRLFYNSILVIESMMEAPESIIGFYYAWGTGPTHTEQSEPSTAINASLLNPVVIIPKEISTTVMLSGAATAAAPGTIRGSTLFPSRALADARLSAGDDAHDIDGFIVTVKRTADNNPDTNYVMGNSPTAKMDETVHWVSPDKKEFKLYGVPADSRFRFGLEAYRIVDPDVDAAGILKSTLIQYPAVGQDALSPENVDFTGNIAGVSASTVKDGAAAGTTAKAATDNIWDVGSQAMIAAWKPSAATALPESWSGGLFANSQYLGFADSSKVWKTFLDNAGNFYLGGIDGGLTWTSSSNTLGIYFSDTMPGGITMSTGGFLKGGQTAFNTGSGFFLGYESSAYKFSIGAGGTGQGMTWDGTNLSIRGSITVTNPEQFGSPGATRNFNSQPGTSDAYAIGDTWADTTNTPPRLWKCITAKSAGAAFDYAHWEISSTRIFSSQPVPPYAIGDIWPDTATYKTYKCTTARPTGSFVQGDWTLSGDGTESTLQSSVAITAGGITLTPGGGNSGYIRSGKTAYSNSDTGFILGTDGTIPKFYIGNTLSYLNWTGSGLVVKGDISGSTGAFEGTLSASKITAGTISLGGSVSIGANGIVGTGFSLGASGLVVTAGSITAANGTFSGSITGASGTFGGVSISSSGISCSPYFSLSSSGLSLGSGTTLTAPTINGVASFYMRPTQIGDSKSRITWQNNTGTNTSYIGVPTLDANTLDIVAGVSGTGTIYLMANSLNAVGGRLLVSSSNASVLINQNTGLQFYNHTTTASVGAYRSLFVANGNLYYRDAGGVVRTIWSA